MDRQEAQAVKSRNQAKKDEGDWAGIQAGKNEGGSGDVVRDAKKTEKPKQIGSGGTR